jgi:hypothetical protein
MSGGIAGAAAWRSPEGNRSMLALLALILLGLAVSFGMGRLLLALLGRVAPGIGEGLTLGDRGLLGMLGLGALAMAVNLVLPLTAWVGGVILLVGAAGLLPGLPWRAAAPPWPLLARATLVLLLAIAARCAIWASGGLDGHYDTGLYHLQAIALAREEPAILGAANIHMRFGYNAMLFPLVAALAAGGSVLAAAATVNVIFLAWIILAVGERLIRPGAMDRGLSWVFGAALLFILLDWQELRWGSAGTPNTDFTPRLLLPYAVLLALALVEHPSGGAAMPGRTPQGADRAPGDALMLAVAVLLAVTLKLSNLPALLLLALPLLAWQRGVLGWRVILAGAGLGLAIGLPWLARGVMTSGCLAYPVEASCLPVPWRIDPAVALDDVRWMRSWARLPAIHPDIVLADQRWLGPWLGALPREPVMQRIPQLLLAVGALGLLRLAWPGLPTARQRLTPRQHAELGLVMAIALAGTAFWFLGAPLIRYGIGWLLLPPLILLAALAPWPHVETRAGPADRPWAPLVVLIALLAVQNALWPTRKMTQETLTAMPAPPVVAVEPLGSIAGFPLTRPRSGDQCWNTPLICTPTPAAGRLTAERVGPWLLVRPVR